MNIFNSSKEGFPKRTTNTNEEIATLDVSDEFDFKEISELIKDKNISDEIVAKKLEMFINKEGNQEYIDSAVDSFIENRPEAEASKVLLGEINAN